MVALALPNTALMTFAQQTEPAKQLPEPVRQIALMAILGIALLGMLLIVATLLGGHWVRRWGDRHRRSAVPPDLMVPRRAEETLPEKMNEERDVD